jgi:hypothetical protein
MTRSIISFVALVSIGALAAACGGGLAEKSAPASTAPSPREEAAPQSIEDAQAQLARARQDLDRSVASAPSSAVPGQPAQPGAGAAASTESRPTSTPARPPADVSATGGDRQNAGTGGGAAPPPPPSPCEQACRALSSMKRAKEAICRMAGDADTRCTDATKAVADGESRVTQCKCQ